MFMTDKLANQLMETLACVAISAIGVPKTEAEFGKINEYARTTFTAILTAWEKVKNEEWEIGEVE